MRATVGRIMLRAIVPRRPAPPCRGLVAAAASVLPLRLAGGEVFEARELADERELDDAGGAVALLRDDQLRRALRVGGRLALVHVHVFAIDEDHDIRVLLERARFAKVR